MAVSLQEIANLSNTSVSTVSRALAGKPGVGARKRDSIRDLAKRLGFRPNQFARNLLSRKSNALGLITANLRNPIHTAFVSLMESEARDRGYQILIADSRRSVEREKENIEFMLSHRAEGLILFPVYDVDSSGDVSHLLELRLQRVPFVVAGEIEGYGFDSVNSDEFDAGERLAGHFLELGHRRFGIVGVDSRRPSVTGRVKGVCSVLRSANLIRDGDIPLEGVEEVLRCLPISGQRSEPWTDDVLRWLDSESRPTALICINQGLALRLIRPLKAHGIRIPDDLSMGAFGEDAWCANAETTLTTMAPTNAEVARLLLETVWRRLEEPEAPSIVHRIPQSFRRRESSGPAPANPRVCPLS